MEPQNNFALKPSFGQRFLHLAITVIGVLIIAGGVYAFLTYNNQTATSNISAGWKTYSSEKYGFEFKYPEGYILEFGNREKLFGEGYPFLTIDILPNFSSRNILYITLKDGSLTEGYKEYQYCNASNSYFAGRKTIKNICGEGGGSAEIYTIQLSDNVLLSAWIRYDEVRGMETNEIPNLTKERFLESFKFTK